MLIRVARVHAEATRSYYPRMRVLALSLFSLLLACRSASTVQQAGNLWSALQPLCGYAFAGRLVEGTEASDALIGEQQLVMHVRACSDREIRIPFHVGENRSRTWVITRTGDRLRLKHDHRHADGTEDPITQYGGDAVSGDDDLSVDFFADEFTATLIPAASKNIWTLAISPDKTFTYALRREATGRRFRVEFDLTKRIAAPPPPW